MTYCKIVVWRALVTSVGVVTFWIPIAYELILYGDAWCVEPIMHIAIAELIMCVGTVPPLFYLWNKLITGKITIDRSRAFSE